MSLAKTDKSPDRRGGRPAPRLRAAFTRPFRRTCRRIAVRCVFAALLAPASGCAFGRKLLFDDWGGERYMSNFGLIVPIPLLGSGEEIEGSDASRIVDEVRAGLYGPGEEVEGTDQPLLRGGALVFHYLPSSFGDVIRGVALGAAAACGRRTSPGTGWLAYAGGGFSYLKARVSTDTPPYLSDFDTCVGCFLNAGAVMASLHDGFAYIGVEARITFGTRFDLFGESRSVDGLELWIYGILAVPEN